MDQLPFLDERPVRNWELMAKDDEMKSELFAGELVVKADSHRVEFATRATPRRLPLPATQMWWNGGFEFQCSDPFTNEQRSIRAAVVEIVMDSPACTFPVRES